MLGRTSMSGFPFDSGVRRTLAFPPRSSDSILMHGCANSASRRRDGLMVVVLDAMVYGD